jgi:hypothetical protein
MSLGTTIIGWVILLAMVVVLARLMTDDDNVKKVHGGERMLISDEQLLRITAAVDSDSEPDVEQLRKTVEHLRKNNARLLDIVKEQEVEIKRLRAEATSLSRLRDKFDFLENENRMLRENR